MKTLQIYKPTTCANPPVVDKRKATEKQVAYSEKLRKWLNDRPELSIYQLETNLGLAHGTLAKVKTAPEGKKPLNLPEHHWKPLEKILRKYGWKG